MRENKYHLSSLLGYMLMYFSEYATVRNALGGQKKLEGTGLLSQFRALRVNWLYLLALVINMTFMVSGILFLLYSSRLSHEETITDIKVATRQLKFAIDEHVSEELSTLSSAAIAMEGSTLLNENKKLSDDDKVFDKITQALSSYNSYVEIGFAGLDGQAVWRDSFGRKRYTSQLNDDFITQVITNQKTLSNTRWDEVSGTHVNVYAVPIYASGTTTLKGVLFAAAPEDQMRVIINNSLHSGQGLAHIIDRNGVYVVKSRNPMSLSTGNDIFALPKPLDQATRDKILATMRDGQSGYLVSSIYGEDRLIAYAPLDINDWYVFYIVPEDMVNAGLKNIISGAMAIIIVAMIIFAAFILLIHKINNKARRMLENIAFIDPVTNERNYNKFLLDANIILRNSTGNNYAICYSDIQDFRYINDIFGRAAGDRLLRYWSAFLHEITHEGEIFGRMGGDIFVALLKYQSRHELERRFTSMAHRMAVYPETLARGYKVEVCGGMYLMGETSDRLGLNDMLDRAITAQKSVKKKNGGMRLGFYSREMRAQKLWEAKVEATMETALENNEFHMYLQPKIDIQNGNRIMGAEALARWIPPDKDPIPPDRFIGIFERNGFIATLDKFIFESACRHYSESVTSGNTPQYVLSVNVSKLTLIQPEFCTIYAGIKEQYGVPDGFIELEFTESLVFENHALLQAIVSACKRNGFLCSLDDFGAGYSSLNLLKSIYVDVLKLDRQFFKYGDNPARGRELVKNIVVMAKALGMKIVAEGIDRPEQVEQLREMGCDAVQGYIFAKPMPVNDFGQFYKNWCDSGGQQWEIDEIVTSPS